MNVDKLLVWVFGVSSALASIGLLIMAVTGYS